jgi:DNA (cytosine-5)-methyltransferase 1
LKKNIKKSKKFPLKVVELFAGVGGFRLGLESVANRKAFEVIWSNQHEPGSRRQWASEAYRCQFPDSEKSSHSDKLIEEAIAAGEVPKEFDVLVGGFPCQDYSVAKPKNYSRGINGKKGVLWWSIYEILKNSKPEYIILENVDRLIKSPSKQRGRDFAIMLKCLATLGYIVEWRVINAADYGMPQRRRRVFIVGYKPNSKQGHLTNCPDKRHIIFSQGILCKAFPVQDYKPDSKIKKKEDTEKTFEVLNRELNKEPHELTDSFNRGNTQQDPFKSAGLMIPTKDGKAFVLTEKVYSKFSGKSKKLGDLLVNSKDVPEEFLIDKESLKTWLKQKNKKSEIRTNYLTTFQYIKKLFAKAGAKCVLTNSLKYSWRKKIETYRNENSKGGKPLEFKLEGSSRTIKVSWEEIDKTKTEYHFKEGPLPMPDPLDRPLRTIITSEGDSSPSRFKHIICCKCALSWKKNKKTKDHDCVNNKEFRRLTPVELERGNMFPDNHTKYSKVGDEKEEISSKKRAFFMGNALVVGVVRKIGESLYTAIQDV